MGKNRRWGGEGEKEGGEDEEESGGDGAYLLTVSAYKMFRNFVSCCSARLHKKLIDVNCNSVNFI